MSLHQSRTRITVARQAQAGSGRSDISPKRRARAWRLSIRNAVYNRLQHHHERRLFI